MTDEILPRDRVPALSESARLAVDCARYLQMLLNETDNGAHVENVDPMRVQELTGLDMFRQAQVRTALRIAGLMHIQYADDGYRLALGDGR